VLIEGLSYQEAADVLEVPVGTLTSRLSRGREALAALLGEVE
jgi:RNA polymerase sigma-70 factor (ECF subfamily)